ncbi:MULTISPECIES: branched-chain amino acid ABC transporter permease [Streptomyces]|uniref:Branched-chain amino acid ABC transporter permease n=1 Tax=Streptomyces tsukubensis (strain DSM 42081 / NBRC 108919 / NRRL 18488 / 9993) TaxID=1114943 RepID=I2MWK3_STRT9|nr:MULTISPECIES: branched-chain amino acid ABC transporter permease [Streptomyces]AZK93577.1 branched-chain amino acid ABC transporter permease [Streptomyces tsukubensis]EIF89150.1 inner-membrane translocator [Streptomyces tsukubensis NRRL18488]MYS66766.1 branched-chain amino acid ABC transporter permease [Streptomyces sp. SID5473]QKM70274.1 branched-chain amino acid ABC transporter permease [Streptomyces tsukubensis NRRL18488]TAI45744.1 branched-chain amino acid ABC transporter permease [Stre
MTTQTSPTAGSTAPADAESRARMLRTVVAAGGVATVISTLLAWTYTDEFPGDLTVYGYPGGLQILSLVAGLLVTVFALAGLGVKGLGWLVPAGSARALRMLALGAFGTTGYTIVAIAYKLGGLANLEPGGFVALVVSAVPLAAFALPDDTRQVTRPKELPSWAEILIIVGVFALGLYVITYGIDTEYAELFTGYLILVGFAMAGLNRSGLLARLSALTARYRQITVISAFAAAAAFPFTQNTDTYTLIAVNILIFATVALGLNIVVGLAGLLDLGYVAFLGVGAYTAALVSGSTASAFDIHFPFWAAVITGGVVSLVFGVIIGAPTLRLRGDYLAIVTLGFGEIFRIAMLNLDGDSGPDITNGPNGIPNIPDLEFFGFNFGEPHTVLGFELGSYANYYLLMLLVTVVVVMVFKRAEDSRMGRAWVAIREDETAATAMGINGFRVKLIAFALGAFLAGLAGTVQAHVQHTVVPEMYQFAGPVPPNSAFLLAAVILGGMGTVSGPLLGAALLYMIPAKLDFLADYQLLGFGIALILLMRFRPEGLIANRRAQLEYHEGDDDPSDQGGSGSGVGLSKAGA